MANNRNIRISAELDNYIHVADEKLNNDMLKYTVDFNELKAKNPDVVSFLIVNGTDIKYPVVKSVNNDFYLKHNFYKEYNVGGWIFSNYLNKFDGTDKNILIFGHNMKNGSMFGTLKNVLTDDWQQNSKNFLITLITEYDYRVYRVFSTYEIKDEDYYLNSNFSTDEEYMNFLDTLKRRSNHDYDVDLSSVDSILTLSTCGNTNQYRIVLHAKMEKEWEIK